MKCLLLLTATLAFDQPSTKIIGGEDVKSVLEYPFMLYEKPCFSFIGNGCYDCAASLITTNYAISAAHCFFYAQKPATTVYLYKNLLDTRNLLQLDLLQAYYLT